jgi:hypothetical protein
MCLQVGCSGGGCWCVAMQTRACRALSLGLNSSAAGTWRPPRPLPSLPLGLSCQQALQRQQSHPRVPGRCCCARRVATTRHRPLPTPPVTAALPMWSATLAMYGGRAPAWAVGLAADLPSVAQDGCCRATSQLRLLLFGRAIHTSSRAIAVRARASTQNRIRSLSAQPSTPRTSTNLPRTFDARPAGQPWHRKSVEWFLHRVRCVVNSSVLSN